MDRTEALIVLFLILLFLTGSLSAQFGLTPSQHPPGLEWRTLRTTNFRILFPREITSEAQRVAAILEESYGPLGATLEVQARPITVILNNQLTVPNAFVALAPRYSEWYSVPPQSTFGGTAEWFTNLAVHEGRHIFQMDKANRGFTRVASVLTGDAGRAAFSFFAIPAWWWEGDAVTAETVLTQGGRGRMPGFDLFVRAPLLSGHRYSYYKAYLGSYRDMTPNIYQLGYFMTTHVRREQGPLAWSRIIDRTSRLSFLPFNFNRAIRGETGQSLPGLYHGMLDELEDLWGEQKQGLALTPFQAVSRPPGVWTSYIFPHYDRDGSIVAQKFGLAHAAQLVRIRPDGREERLRHFSPRELTGTRASLGAGLVVWDEAYPDLRWAARSFSSIVVYDLRSGRSRRLTSRTRLMNPSISPDGSHLAAVEMNTRREFALVILDAHSGKVIERLSNPENDWIMAPVFSEDGSRIVFILQGDNDGRSLTMADLVTGEQRDLVPRGWDDIHYPAIHGDYAFYTSPVSGIDNIYAVEISGGRRYQVTSSHFGASFPHVSEDGSRLLYSEYFERGYRIVEAPLDPAAWKPLEQVEDRSLRYYAPLLEQEPIDLSVPAAELGIEQREVRPYRAWADVLNIHSWAFVPLAPEGGAAFVSRNVMNTTALTGAVNYNTNERTAGFRGQLTYAGLFPMLDFDASHRQRIDSPGNGPLAEDRWRESSLSTGFRVPLNLSRGTHRTAVTIASQVAQTRVADRHFVGRDRTVVEQGNGRLAPLYHQAAFSRTRISAPRDVRPPWAQNASLFFAHTPLGGDFRGNLISASTTALFPGLLRHHSLALNLGVENQDPENYRFGSRLVFPRGYRARSHERLLTARADYLFPLAYPDSALGPLLYVRRVKLGAFYDYTRGDDPGFAPRLYRSAGMELRFDLNLLTLLVPLDVGVRWAYRFDTRAGERSSRLEPTFFYQF
jgi:hypothetical protein